MTSSLESPAPLVVPPAAPVVRHWIGPLMVFGGGVCIGFAPIGLRLGLDDLGPQAIAFWRYLFAAPVLLALVVLIERRAPRPPNRFVLMAGTFFTLDMALWHWSLTLTTVSNATFIVNLGNISVGFMAWLFLKERPTNKWFVAVVLAVLGAAVLSLGGEVGGKGDIRGDMLALAAALLVSGYMLCSKLARRTLGGLETIFWLTLVEICIASLIVALSGESFLPENLSGFRAPLFLALIVQVMGQGLIITGLGRTPAAIAGVVVIVQPVVAAAISWSLFDEPLTALQAAGAGAILAAVWLSQRGKPVPID
ncbi:DMT family transporter [Hyphomonas sp.]|jgi:drug/metabolite transporter (DMT)-like permease|uniref:DMT family transporter n=1 Tax=Hyphomonas sp. TaxID=87 RepID=UPI0039E325F6